MAEERVINTVIVLRNDQTTVWESSDHVMLKGEVGIGYLANGNVIAKLGDGEHTWKALPQIEGVFEDDVTLTYNFGRHTTKNGFVKTDAKGMTTSQWLLDALSEIKEPTITQPTFKLTASGIGAGGEIGSYITGLKWDGTTTYGSYEFGPATGLSASNRTWAISNNVDNQTSTSEDGTFTLTSTDYIQLTQEASKTYATITGTYNLDASSAAAPYNNVGQATSGKITDKTDTLTANINSVAYRKPFWGLKAEGDTLNLSALTSAQIRALGNSGTSNGDLPSTFSVPVGTQQVIFAAKSGVKASLAATGAMNSPVDFTMVAKAVKVEGANGFEGIDYDVWYVDFTSGVDAAVDLALTWA